MGVDRLPYGAFQIRLLLAAFGSGDHFSGKFFSGETPFCSGPRHWYQSVARPWLPVDKPATNNNRRNRFMRAPVQSFSTIRRAFISKRGNVLVATVVTSARNNSSS